MIVILHGVGMGASPSDAPATTPGTLPMVGVGQ